MKKNIKIILALLVTVVIIGVAFFSGTKKNNSPAPVQTADQTANWKTYTNKFYSYSFKYPSDWFLIPMTVSGKGDRDNLNSFDMKQFEGKDLSMSGDRVGIEVGFVGNRRADMPINEWFNTPEGNTVLQLSSPDYTTIGGEQAVVGLDGSKRESKVYYFAHGLNIYTIWLNGESTSENFKKASVILSTFKFTDQAPNAVIYEMHFNPHDAQSDYESHDNIKYDDQKKVTVFNNGNIYFEYEPNKYTLSYQILNNPPEGPKEKQTQIINLEDANNKYKLGIKLHMYGIGGACPDFPKGYEMFPIILDNKNISKAKFIDKKTANLNWPLGNIYLVDKGQYGWNCPNVASLSSVKNGSVVIEYDLSSFGQNYNSQDYIAAEKSLDKIVSTIRNFWQ